MKLDPETVWHWLQPCLEVRGFSPSVYRCGICGGIAYETDVVRELNYEYPYDLKKIASMIKHNSKCLWHNYQKTLKEKE